MIGKTLGHYRIVEKIGAGGMGEVYRARDERLERDVAIKVLPVGTLTDEHARKRFRKEALTLSKLNHPHIATVHDFDTQEGVDFLVMEYVAGETLAAKLKSGALPEKETAKLGGQVAEALEEAHEHKVIHRDLKPGNIALTAKGQVKVLDFGIAKLLRSEKEAVEATTESFPNTQTFAGTLPYMAPEQVRGEAVDARTDIHALGAVLYEMATGQRAFPDRQPAQLTAAILQLPVSSPRALNRRVSPGLEGIILKALEKEPENRYQSAKEVGVDLRRLGRGTSTTALAPWQVPRGWARWGWRLAGVGLAVAVLLAVLVGLNVAGLRDRLLAGVAPGQITSIAVLPLANLSGDPEQDYFVEGMHEALITELSKISALRVISRTSAMQYKHASKPLPDIARELDVDAVVEGSVFLADGRVRVTAQLVQARPERHLWANNFDRELSDVLALHSEVARAIAREIKIAVTPEEETRLAATRPANPEAYEAYLNGRHYWNLWPEGSDRAIEYFQEATEKDPKYAPAYAALARSYTFLSFLNRPPKEVYPKARAAALRALELDETLAEAHTAIGGVKLFYDWDWEGAERAWRRALELNPNSVEALRLSWIHLIWTRGQFEEGLARARRARDLDPLNRFVNGVVAYAYLRTRRYDEAIAQYRSILELHPNFFLARHQLGCVYLFKGMHAEALAEYKAAYKELGEQPDGNRHILLGLGCIYAKMGRRDDARRVADNLTRISSQEYVDPYLVAALYACLGDKDQAFAWLEKAYQDRSAMMPQLKVEAFFDPLRDDARFQSLLRRMNFPE